MLLTVLLGLAAACDEGPSGNEGPSSTETPAVATDQPAEPTSGASPTPVAPSSAIRDIDFRTVEELSQFITNNGGEIDPAAIIFVDLTGDNAEDAIVPVASGGTLGNLAVFVYSAGAYGPALLLQVQPEGDGGIVADVQEGQLFIDEASFAPNDPECCPSQITRRYYVWDGDELVVDHEEQVPGEPGSR